MTILGSGTIVSQLASHNLIDEYQIMIDPVALSQGTPLFAGMHHALNLKLTETRPFSDGTVLLTYQTQ
jgi:dihydrofolate reductase